MKKNKKSGYKKGYMTVEASVIMPLLVTIILFMVIFCFYLYNNCVVFQDCYISALRGSQIMDSDSSEIKSKVEVYICELLDNQVFEYGKNSDVEVSALSVKVAAKSSVSNMFHSMGIYNKSSMDIDKSGEAARIDPTLIIRMKY
ncbi:MAG: pilus assembly protein [Lachnospiraceae bacterium]|nr:pilus assembly protein [Lachnospiraceae bacterium]